MPYWVPGLADKLHEHPECAGHRIARETLRQLTIACTGLAGTEAVESESSQPANQ